MGTAGIDRKQAPALHSYKATALPEFQAIGLPNGMPCYSLLAGDLPAGQIQLVFGGGVAVQGQPLVAEGCMQVLARGTQRRSESEVFGKLDGMGTRLRCTAQRDYCIVTLTAVEDRMAESAELLHEIVCEPRYDGKSVANWQRQSASQLAIELQEGRILASRGLSNALYPTGHPYRREWQPADYTNATADRLRAYHRQMVGSNNCRLFAYGGRIGDALLRAYELFGQMPWGAPTAPVVGCVTTDYEPEQHIVRSVSPLESQVSIALGRRITDCTAEELIDLKIAVTLLGGFFGSRLMKNLREDKGYTYGIHARLLYGLAGAELRIVAEIGDEQALVAVREIALELRHLREKKASVRELEILRGYLVGQQLRAFDGPFASGPSLIIPMLYSIFPADWYQRSLQRIATMTAESIQTSARKWLDPASMVLSVAGSGQTIDKISWPLLSL